MDATRQALIDAIYGQESSHGKADTSRENYAGARGPMQVTRSTFDSLKGKGIIPNNFDHANPDHGYKAGVALIGYLANKYENDPVKVAAAYYAGEKAVRADGTIADFRDLKNPKAPTTHQYVQQILTRMGGDAPDLGDGGLAPDGTPRGIASKANVLDAWDEGYGPRPDKIGKLKAAADMPVAADTALPNGPGTAYKDMAAEGARNQAHAQEVLDTSLLDASKAVFMHDTLLGNVLKRVARDNYGDPQPGFKIDPKDYEGMTKAEQSALSEATNPEHLSRIKAEIAVRRQDMDTADRNGPWVRVAADIMGGLPEGYATGAMGSLGAAKAAAMAGVRTRAGIVGVAAAENIGGNLAVTAAQAAIDPYTGVEDAPMAVGMGLIGTALHLPGIGRQAEVAQTVYQANKIMREAAERAVKFEGKARATLGEGATREQMQVEINRLQAEDAKAHVQGAMAPVSGDRRLLPADEPLVAKPHETPKADPLPLAADMEPGKPRDKMASEHPTWNDPAFVKRRTALGDEEGSALSQTIMRITGDEHSTAQSLRDEFKPGVHVLENSKEHGVLGTAVRALKEMAGQFLPKDTRIIISHLTGTPEGVKESALGEIVSAGNVHVIGLKPRGDGMMDKVVRTAVHELGHAVFHTHAQDIPPSLLARMVSDHERFVQKLLDGSPEARAHRFSVTSGNAMEDGALKVTKYAASFDEYTAEQFVKHIEREAVTRADGVHLSDGVRDSITRLVERMKEFFGFAKAKGYLGPDDSFSEFFGMAMRNELRAAKKAELEVVSHEAPVEADLSAFSTPITAGADPLAVRYGLDLMPQGTPQQRAEYKAVHFLYTKADAWAKLNPKDEKKLSKLMNTGLFQNAESITATMLRSDNPVVRMIASELMESANGAGGRRSTAAVAKHLHEQAFVGNSVNEFQGAYSVWRKEQGGTVVGDFTDGKLWEQFNRLVAEELENRRGRTAQAPQVHPAIKDAADRMESAYERMRVAQQQAKTVGWGALPESSVGYMPHRLSSEKVRNLTTQQKGALHTALVDQFVNIEGFDISFSANLASKYIDRIQRRALGGTEAPANIHQTGAADVVEEALGQMGMSKPEIDAAMARYMKGGAGHTKQRLKLDLNQIHEDGAGGNFRLLDLFETDQLRLLRSQAGRVSGEVALAGHGVMGKPGLSILRRAMEFGADNGKTQGRELEAFDQMSAEFLGDPFGTASSAVWMNRAMQVTSLARLGGMGFTQLAESINAIVHVGAGRALASVGSLNRLRREAAALARGEHVDNPLLQSIEQFSGVDFGTANRKMVFPFDNQTLQYQSYGKDTLTMADRLLRGATHLQGKLSFWQAIHGAQQRGMAEQIVSKAMEYIRAGKNDVALRDMGISDELASKLRADLDHATEFHGDKLQSFDITKFKDAAAATEFVQAVHRGVSQIIQDTFIGERGKWAHDATARMFTQFRTFSITSVEKQWGRQVNNHGVAKAFGILMGSMSVAAPLYIARVYAASIGRKDQEAYLEKQLTAFQIARASMNYVAASGLAGDFVDALTAVAGGNTVGGRAGAEKSFVGNMVAPSLGLVDDVWRASQNTKEGTDPTAFLKNAPFSRHPALIPAINALGH